MTERAPIASLRMIGTETAVAKEWQHHLSHLLDAHPQTQRGRIQYVLEGGAAVTILRSNRMIRPHDLDILIYDDRLKEELKADDPDWNDVHTVRDWFFLRGIPYTPSGESYLKRSHRRVRYDGHEVIILSPAVLAASKTFSYEGSDAPREKDLFDIINLKIPGKIVDRVRAHLVGS